MHRLLPLVLVSLTASCAILRDDLPGENGPDASMNSDADGENVDVAPPSDQGTAAGDTGDQQVDADAGTDTGGEPTYADVVLASEPIAYWRLNEAATPIAVDETGNGYDGIYDGVPTLGVPGPFDDAGTAVQFAGESIEVDGFPQFSDRAPFTVEAWFRTDDATIPGAIIGHTDRPEGLGTIGWRISIDDNAEVPRLRGQRHNHSAYGPEEIEAGTWYYAALVYDGANIILFRNRTIVDDRSSDLVEGPVESALLIGTATRWGSFQGTIDEVAIYDRALAVPELVEHYEAGMGAP